MKQLSAALEEKGQAVERLEREAARAAERAAGAEGLAARIAEELEEARAGVREGAAGLEAQVSVLESALYSVSLAAESAAALELQGALRVSEMRAALVGLEAEVAAAERLPGVCGARVAHAVCELRMSFCLPPPFSPQLLHFLPLFVPPTQLEH